MQQVQKKIKRQNKGIKTVSDNVELVGTNLM